MTESRVVWLGIGIFVGYLIWKDRAFQRAASHAVSDSPFPLTDSGSATTQGLPPGCGSC